MKRLTVFIAIMLALTMLPAAHAALRIQSVSSNLYSFDGPTRINYDAGGFAGAYYKNNGRMYIGAGSTSGGPFVSTQLQRNTYTRNHYFDQPKYNYRTYEQGPPRRCRRRPASRPPHAAAPCGSAAGRG